MAAKTQWWLAIQSEVSFSFSQPPTREVLLELAATRNLIPLPKSGVPLPPEQDKARYTKEVSFSRNLKKQEDDEEVTDPTAQSSQQQQQTSELPSQTPQRVSFPLSRLPK
ncbi:transcription initiation factor TFIID subunit 9-like [Raphanus sativus]|uniref:Transcription initiation factor TFIID subunit 9-like n=1 Tax=Raphanus sativus TaxID=3726 RepID=A0A9W3C5N9_RAPSA|nr:transcription initiation factor TFIID subunit 9-like [Raphanus sativus]